MSEKYGKYELIKRLATGGMAQIYLARQTGIEGFEKLCVVKRILPHLAENDDFVKMFLHEAKIAARLNHPNVVQILDLGRQEHDGSFFIAMEFIHGEDLRRVWKRAEQLGMELPIPFVLRVVADAAAGLDYAHKKSDPDIGPLNIVHRDISPQNILVSFEGAVKVVDFGIAKAADADMNTRSGVLKGKYSYMSPEQASGNRDIDHRTDLFALGTVLYELLTGTRLFKRGNDIQTLNAVMECDLAPPSAVNARIPKDLDPVVLKALTKSPDDRYANGREMQLALDHWLVAHQQPASNAHVAEKMQELYAERLAAEAKSGLPVPDEGFEVPKSAEEEISPRRKANTNRGARPLSASGLAPARERPVTPPPLGPAPIAKHEEATTSLKPDRRSPSRAQRPVPSRGTGAGAPAPSASSASAGASSAAANASPPPPTPRTRTNPGMTEISLTDADVKPLRGKVTLALVIAGLVAVAAGVVWALRPTDVSPASLATVQVDSDPRGATVIFNGRTVAGLTPLTLPSVPEGTYTLIVGKERYRDKTLSVAIPESGEHALPLVRLDRMDESPVADAADASTGAGTGTGSTHGTASGIAGAHANGTDSAGGDPGGEVKPALVALSIEAEPSNAALTVDGKPRGPSPAVLQLPRGSEVTVRAELAGYVTMEKKIHVGASATQKETLSLEKRKREGGGAGTTHPVSANAKDPRDDDQKPDPVKAIGTVRFVINPLGTWADVSCGSYHFGATPFPDKQLPAGTYDCTFTNPELGTRKERIEVRPNDLSKVAVKFN